eukprot:tig00000789_g4134.t1
MAAKVAATKSAYRTLDSAAVASALRIELDALGQQVDVEAIERAVQECRGGIVEEAVQKARRHQALKEKLESCPQQQRAACIRYLQLKLYSESATGRAELSDLEKLLIRVDNTIEKGQRRVAKIKKIMGNKFDGFVSEEDYMVQACRKYVESSFPTIPENKKKLLVAAYDSCKWFEKRHGELIKRIEACKPAVEDALNLIISANKLEYDFLQVDDSLLKLDRRRDQLGLKPRLTVAGPAANASVKEKSGKPRTLPPQKDPKLEARKARAASFTANPALFRRAPPPWARAAAQEEPKVEGPAAAAAGPSLPPPPPETRPAAPAAPAAAKDGKEEARPREFAVPPPRFTGAGASPPDDVPSPSQPSRQTPPTPASAFRPPLPPPGVVEETPSKGRKGGRAQLSSTARRRWKDKLARDAELEQLAALRESESKGGSAVRGNLFGEPSDEAAGPSGVEPSPAPGHEARQPGCDDDDDESVGSDDEFIPRGTLPANHRAPPQFPPAAPASVPHSAPISTPHEPIVLPPCGKPNVAPRSSQPAPPSEAPHPAPSHPAQASPARVQPARKAKALSPIAVPARGAGRGRGRGRGGAATRGGVANGAVSFPEAQPKGRAQAPSEEGAPRDGQPSARGRESKAKRGGGPSGARRRTAKRPEPESEPEQPAADGAASEADKEEPGPRVTRLRLRRQVGGEGAGTAERAAAPRSSSSASGESHAESDEEPSSSSSRSSSGSEASPSEQEEDAWEEQAPTRRAPPRRRAVPKAKVAAGGETGSGAAAPRKGRAPPKKKRPEADDEDEGAQGDAPPAPKRARKPAAPRKRAAAVAAEPAGEAEGPKTVEPPNRRRKKAEAADGDANPAKRSKKAEGAWAPKVEKRPRRAAAGAAGEKDRYTENFRGYKLKSRVGRGQLGQRWRAAKPSKGAARPAAWHGDGQDVSALLGEHAEDVCRALGEDAGPSSSSSAPAAPEAPAARQQEAEAAVSSLFTQEAREYSREALGRVASAVFGFKELRDGQYEIVSRILAGHSTLAALPTGAGKTLCYMLPAVVHSVREAMREKREGQARQQRSVVLVVSPLVALMHDQLRALPVNLGGALLEYGTTLDEEAEIFKRLKEGNARVLFASCERVTSERFLRAAAEPAFPRVSLACVDEAHLISDWGHSFRPCYLTLAAALRRLGAPTTLALTATATRRVEREICDTLSIPRGPVAEGGGVVRRPLHRPNLLLTATHLDAETKSSRTEALLELLKSERMRSKSVIVYTAYKWQVDLVCRQLQEHEISAAPYMGDMDSKSRRGVLDSFRLGKIQVVVATVAFGMGIDKPDLGAVVHWTLPRSPETYLQEVGRAGRDGRDAEGHVFIRDEDYRLLRSRISSDTVDADPTVARLLHRLFAPGRAHASLFPRVAALAKKTIPTELSMQPDMVATLLTYLAQDKEISPPIAQLLPAAQVMGSFSLERGVSLLALHQRFEVVRAVAEATAPQATFTFALADVANAIGQDLEGAADAFRALQRERQLRFFRSEDGLAVRLLRAPREGELAEIAARLAARIAAFERISLRRLDSVYAMLRSAAVPLRVACLSRDDGAAQRKAARARREASDDEAVGRAGRAEKSGRLQAELAEYMAAEPLEPPPGTSTAPPYDPPLPVRGADSFDRADVRTVLRNAAKMGVRLLPRQVARALHGLQGPGDNWNRNSPPSWCGDLFRKKEHVDFNDLLRDAMLAMPKQGAL